MVSETVITYNFSETLIDRSSLDPDRQHELIKVDDGGWQCQCCYQKWRAKPRAKCLGLPVFPDAADSIDWHRLISLHDAIRTNLKLKQVTKPIAADRDPLNTEREFDSLLYARADFEECEPDLLPIKARWQWNKWGTSSQPKDSNSASQGRFYTRSDIDYRKLELKPDAQPAAVYFRNFYPGLKQCAWVLLYRSEDTQPRAPKYISKANLQAVYLISDGWLKRIGNPDLLLDNPHGKYYAPMRMYGIEGVERFLSEHAIEYANWLEGRGKRLEIARQTIAKSQVTKQKLKTQTKQCLGCASHSALIGGTCCAIYPVTWAVGVPLERYCPDFHPRGAAQND
jgi:hypothetical protein